MADATPPALMIVSAWAAVTVSSPLGASRSGRPIARCEPADRGEKRATDEEAAGEQRKTEHHGGTDPARLIERYAGRVVSLHLKDLKKGAPVKAGTATGTADVDVPVGSGQIDMPAVLRAAMKARVSAYYLEDESADPWGHIPQSLTYLKNFK